MDAKTQEILDKIDALCLGVQECLTKLDSIERTARELDKLEGKVFEHIERGTSSKISVCQRSQQAQASERSDNETPACD